MNVLIFSHHIKKKLKLKLDCEQYTTKQNIYLILIPVATLHVMSLLHFVVDTLELLNFCFHLVYRTKRRFAAREINR